MRKKLALLSIFTLFSLLVAGETMAWLSYKKEISIKFQLEFPKIEDSIQGEDNMEEAGQQLAGEAINLEVIETGQGDISDVEEGSKYVNTITIKNLGDGDVYIRIRIIPSWSNPNLTVSNVTLDIGDDSMWQSRVEEDGYYYYKTALSKDEDADPLRMSMTFGELGPDYQNETFSLKTVVEGIDAGDRNWESIWEID